MDHIRKHYDDWYKRKPGQICMKPDDVVKRASDLIQPGKGLDIGSGFGRNSLYLARKGFSVKAIDLSIIATERLRQQAETAGLPIEVVKGDICQELLQPEFLIIISTFVLHHFPQEGGERLIRRMQEKVTVGGLNVIATHAKDDAYGNDRYVYEEHCYSQVELLKLYEGWNIMFCENRLEPVGFLEFNPVLSLIAQKITP